MRARYYTPYTARFIQQDTVWGNINVPLTQNLYAYCRNNPLNMIDPSGRYPQEAYEYYKNKLDKATNSYVSLEKSYDRMYSSMDKMWVKSQMEQNKKDISSYEQTLTKMTRNPVSDSIEKARTRSEREDCRTPGLVSGISLLNGKTIKLQNHAGKMQNFTIKWNELREIEALVRMTQLNDLEPTLLISIFIHESRLDASQVNSVSGATGYAQILPEFYNVNLNRHQETCSIAYEYAQEGIKDSLNPYGNMAAEINLLVYWRNLYGEDEMLPPLLQGYKGDEFTDDALQVEKEFLDIKKQLDELLKVGEQNKI